MLRLIVHPECYAVARFDPTDDGLPPELTIPDGDSFVSWTRTPTEISVVCESGQVPEGTKVESGWTRFEVADGPLDFELVGILHGIADVLARAQISLFVLSTFDTDHILVRRERAHEARRALEKAGYTVDST